MLKVKIEATKKKLANLWSNGAISSADYQAALAELEARSTEYTTTESIQREDIVQEAPRIPEVDPSKYRDIDYFEEGVLIPRHIYDEVISKLKKGENIFTAKAMYSAFFLLCKYTNKKGMVIGLTTDMMASYYNYSDSRNLRQGLDKLAAAGLIKIDKSVKPHIYQINDYNLKCGGFVVPEKLMKKVSTMRLKELRLEWLYMCRNLHSPKNNSKFNLSLGHIRKVVNAGCYKEVIELAKGLKDRFFTKLEEVSSGCWRAYNKLKVEFNSLALGIVEATDNLFSQVSASIKDKLEYIFAQLELKESSYNYRQALALMEEYSEYELQVVEQNIRRGRIDKSTTGSVNYLKKWLELARSQAIVIQY